MAKNKHYRAYAVTTMAAAVAVAPIVASAGETTDFTDVTDKSVPDKEMQAAITNLVEQKAMRGYADHTFKPNAPVLRGQVAQVLTKTLDLQIPEDVEAVNTQYKDAHEFGDNAKYIAAVTEASVFEGNGKNFKGWDSMTREQFATVMERYMTSQGIEANQSVPINLDNVSESHKTGVQFLADFELTKELDDFQAHDKVTRLQFATFFTRAQQVMEDQNEEDNQSDKEAVENEAAKITDDITVKQDSTKLDMPEVSDGYSVAIKSSDNGDVIKTDETVIPPAAETTVDVVFTVTKDDTHYVADTDPVEVVVEKKSVDEGDKGDDKKHDDAVDDNEDAKEKMKKLNFDEIEVEADYGKDNEYEVEIEHKSDDTYTSEIEDETGDNVRKINGQEAFDELYPMAEKLDINKTSSKEEVFGQVLKAFELDDNYKELEVEITFHDGEKLEYEEK